MSQTVVSEIPDSLLFRFRLRCRKFNSGGKEAAELASSHALPLFGEGELPSGKPFAQLRAGWNEQGMYFWLKVKGKKQSLWCRNTQLLESDGLQIWLDTRDTHNVHRATRFCHWFLLLPAGGGPATKKPIATMLKINRAKEHSPAINQMPISVDSKLQKSGYELAAFLPAECLNGWDSADHRLIGFNYVVNDRELGSQSLAVGLDYPVAEDPALWNTLVLAE
jgi:hypothetical protein